MKQQQIALFVLAPVFTSVVIFLITRHLEKRDKEAEKCDCGDSVFV